MGQILGGIGDIFGGIQQGQNAANDTKGLNQINQQIEGNNSQLNPYIGGMLGGGSQLGSTATSGYLGLGETINSEGGLAGAYNGAMGNIADAQGGLGQAQSWYDAARSGGNTASDIYGSAETQTQQAGSYYGGLMANGLDPAVRAAAYSGYNTQTAQADANMKANYTGPNAAGLMEDANFQNMQGRAQLGGQLAAQDQSVRMQGAQGLMGSAAQYAGLGQANYGIGVTDAGLASTQYGLGVDNAQLGMQGYGLASGAMGSAASYGTGQTQLGMQGIQQQNAPLGQIGAEYAGAGQQASSAANADWSGAASGIGGGIASMATGGMANFLNGSAMSAGTGSGFNQTFSFNGGGGANGGVDSYGQYNPYAVTPT